MDNFKRACLWQALSSLRFMADYVRVFPEILIYEV